MKSRAYQTTPTPVLDLLPSLLTTKTNRPHLLASSFWLSIAGFGVACVPSVRLPASPPRRSLSNAARHRLPRQHPRIYIRANRLRLPAPAGNWPQVRRIFARCAYTSASPTARGSRAGRFSRVRYLAPVSRAPPMRHKYTWNRPQRARAR